MLVVIDNYDSFTYNLVQAMGTLGTDMHVVRNDRATLEELATLQPDGFLISPGASRPEDAGISCAVIQHWAGRLPILGVGLGHHCIAHVFGARTVRCDDIAHGMTSAVLHNSASSLFEGIPSAFEATCYHSRTIDRSTLPTELQVTAWNEREEIMGLRHRTHDIEGLLFHPESILTEWGAAILTNFAHRISVPVDEARTQVSQEAR